jgi:hypothetical protein
MSAAAASSTEADLTADAIRSGSIGFSMMVARRLLSPDKPPFLDILLQAFAAALVSVCVGWAAADHIGSKSLLFAVIGVSGAFAPELVAFGLRYFNAKAAAKVAEAEAEAAAKVAEAQPKFHDKRTPSPSKGPSRRRNRGRGRG